MIALFFSYSHANEAMRNELEKHFAVMKRNGLIRAWHDRRILPGTEFDSEIMKKLEESNIILLLISADFLNSNYCYDKEMKRALEKHEKGEAVVIPVIIEPCDWKEASFGGLNALPKDGKPFSKFSNINDACLEVVEGVKKVISEKFQSEKSSVEKRPVTVTVSAHRRIESSKSRSSNLRIKKNFSDQENDDFIEKAYEHIRNYFEESLEELKRRNKHVSTKLTANGETQFIAVIYENGQVVSQCKIWLSNDFGRGTADIKYSHDTSRNSFNESLSVKNDGYIQHLKALGMAFYNYGHDRDQLSLEGAAEYYWTIFIKPLQS